MRYPLKNWKRVKRGYRFGEKTFYSPFHLGTDYLVPEGTVVRAPHNCRIVKAGEFPEGGKTIHASLSVRPYGKVVARFMHLSEYAEVGKYKEGEKIGMSGNTGALTKGPHLHIDISRGKVDLENVSNFIDPEKFFEKEEKKTKRKNIKAK